jgi:hypothetical protein
VLQSNPPGARLSINGVVVGNTPYTMADTKIVGSTTPVRLEYPGYQTIDMTISRNEELDVGALVAGDGGTRSRGLRSRPALTRGRQSATCLPRRRVQAGAGCASGVGCRMLTGSVRRSRRDGRPGRRRR